VTVHEPRTDRQVDDWVPTREVAQGGDSKDGHDHAGCEDDDSQKDDPFQHWEEHEESDDGTGDDRSLREHGSLHGRHATNRL
jgi:hypothetical protein